MTNQNYEPPKLTVLGTVTALTEQKAGGTPDTAGLDGTNSFTNGGSDARLKRDIQAL